MKKLAFLTFALVALVATSCKDDFDEKYPVRDLVKTRNSPQYVYRWNDGIVFLDFGKDAFAQLELALNSDVNDTIIVRLGEKSVERRVDMKPGGSIRAAEYRLPVHKGLDTYRLTLRPDGRNTRTTPTTSGAVPILMPESVGEVYPFRYCELEGFEGNVDDDYCFQVAVHYPFDEKASLFQSDNNVLNQVWSLCKYSIKATSFCGYYVDGDRERIPYEADALINQLSHYGVDSEYAMARRTTEYLLQNPTWPTEWQFAVVFMAWYDYLYTGDDSLIRKYYDVLRAKTLSALRESNGLISTTTGKVTAEVRASINYRGTEAVKDIVDWPRSGSFGIDKKEAGEADGYVMMPYNTAVNAMHYGALLTMADMAEAIGRRSDASEIRSEAAAHLSAFNSLLLGEDGVYRDGIGTSHCSLHANMLPLLYGMVPDSCRESVLDFIKSRGMACSVYGAQLLLDALYSAGEDDYAMSLLTSESRRSWFNMIRCGSTITMEAWDPIFKGNLDWNHAWGAAPANIIPRWVVGVQPLEPGFRSVLVRPHVSSLSRVSSLVPTPYGSMAVGVVSKIGESYSLTVDVPKGIRKAKVMIPLCGSEGATLSVNGKARSYAVEDGCAALTLASGRWCCRLSY